MHGTRSATAAAYCWRRGAAFATCSTQAAPPSPPSSRPLPRVMLKGGKARLFADGTPIVFGGAVDRVVGRPAPRAGDCVVVCDGADRPIGWGVYNPHSMFRVRIMQLAEEWQQDGQQQQQGGLMQPGECEPPRPDLPALLRARLAQAAALRAALGLPSADTTVYRLANSEGDRLSGLVVDVLGPEHAVVSSSAAWVEQQRPEVERWLHEAVGVQHVVWRPAADMLREEGVEVEAGSAHAQDGESGEEEEGAAAAAAPSASESGNGASQEADTVVVLENGVRYAAAPQGQKTGFYADQRDSRLLVRRLAAGRRVLDVCCYSGGFALSAAVGDAAYVTGVDSSAAALALARRNAELNGVQERAAAEGRQWDLLVLDPPKLAPSHKALPRALRKYRSLNAAALALVAPGGLLMTCSCSGAVSQGGEFLPMLAAAARDAGRRLTMVREAGAAPDHALDLGHPEGRYLTNALVRVLKARSKPMVPQADPSQSDSLDRESLVAGGRGGGSAADPPLPHPRLWAVLGAVYIVLGLVEFVYAALWRFWVGIAVGLGVAKLGVSLMGLGMTGGRTPHRPPPVGLKARLKAALWAVVMWGSAKVQRLLYIFRWLIYAYGIVALLMLAIHLTSPDPDIAAFPSACPPGKRFGCSRVAETAPHATRRMQPLHLNVSIEDAGAAAVRWVEAQPQARVLVRSPGFLHARFLSVVWGFADDMFISFRRELCWLAAVEGGREAAARAALGAWCNPARQVLVEVQGQLRIGKSDLGVCGRRNQRFLLALSTAAKAGEQANLMLLAKQLKDHAADAAAITCQLQTQEQRQEEQPLALPAAEGEAPLRRAPKAAAPEGMAAGALTADAILAKRRRFLGPNLATFFPEAPLHITSARGCLLFDEHGDSYLDCINNVSHCGHAHPAVAEAVSRQLCTLNTNSRQEYLGCDLVMYAERLQATLPDPLEVVLPQGYLARVYAEMRGAGAVCIADEVQCGFGRVGAAFWAFELQGVVPDIVTCGKPMGNGFPMAGLITTPRLAEAFGVGGMEFFATAGGCNAAAACGLVVLDVIRREGLVANAARVGSHVKRRLRALQASAHAGGVASSMRPAAAGRGWEAEGCTRALGARPPRNAGRRAARVRTRAVTAAASPPRPPQDVHPEVVGDVRGEGLMLGVELVTDAASRCHAPALARCVKQRCKQEQRVLLSTEGPYGNVIKIKPPICMTLEEADRMVDAMQAVLGGLSPEERQALAEASRQEVAALALHRCTL
eukprot:scaffold2.g7358.t1